MKKKYIQLLFMIFFSMGFFFDCSSKDDESIQSGISLVDGLRDALDLKAYMNMVNDYRWRGVSQTSRRPAIQGEFALESEWGITGKIWASDVGFLAANNRFADIEFDYVLQYKKKIDQVIAEVGFVSYTYPGVSSVNWQELFMIIGYKYFSFGMAYSNDVFNLSERGLYVTLDMEHKLPEFVPYFFKDVSLAMHVGHFNFSGSLSRRDYFDFNVFLKKDFNKHFSFLIGEIFTNRKFVHNKLDESVFIVLLKASI